MDHGQQDKPIKPDPDYSLNYEAGVSQLRESVAHTHSLFITWT